MPNSSKNDTPSFGSDSDEFFIGWLKMPVGYARRVRRATIALAVLAPLLAILASAAQRSPGAGQWENAREVTLEGVAYCRPYAMLRTADKQSNDAVRTFLLVESGKFGAVERMRPFDGQAVVVRGTILHRDGRWMLELVEDDSAVRPLAAPTVGVSEKLRWPQQSQSQRRAVKGEIIDPKCFLGGMKPGGGKSHKACATLCISGGIPPMVFARAANGEPVYYLLVAQDGTAINEAILPFVGDLVDLVGDVTDADGLLMLRIDPKEIKRL
jgi:hypothetical protein